MSIFKKHYYHGSIKRYIGLMLYLFQDLQVESEGKLRTVPVRYSGGEHRIPKESINALPFATMLFSDNETDEIRLLNKHENKLITTQTKQNQRVPNSFMFEYRVRCKKQDEAFQVLEQVLAVFTPSLDVLISDNDEVATRQNIKIKITSWTIADNWEGDGEEPNYYDVLFTLDLSGYLYRQDASVVSISTVEINRTIDGFPEEPWFSKEDNTGGTSS